jgi:hypothetical protein
MLISGRLQTRGESILSEADEIKTMLLELKLTGTIALTDRMSDAFIEAMHEEYIYSVPLDGSHIQDWDWIVTKKGLKYLDKHK